MVASCANWIPEILGRSVRSGYRSSSVCTYPAPITTIFSGRATKALGMRSIAGDVKEMLQKKKKRRRRTPGLRRTGETGHI